MCPHPSLRDHLLGQWQQCNTPGGNPISAPNLWARCHTFVTHSPASTFLTQPLQHHPKRPVLTNTCIWATLWLQALRLLPAFDQRTLFQPTSPGLLLFWAEQLRFLRFRTQSVRFQKVVSLLLFCHSDSILIYQSSIFSQMGEKGHPACASWSCGSCSLLDFPVTWTAVLKEPGGEFGH